MSNPTLAGMEAGMHLVDSASDAFWKAKKYQDQLKLQAEEKKERDANTLTPDQAQFILQGLPERIEAPTIKTPGGDVKIGQDRNLGTAFPGGIKAPIVEQAAKLKEARTVAQTKAEDSAIKGHTKLTKDQAEFLTKKTGFPATEGQYVPDAWITSATKPPAGSAQAMDPKAKEQYAQDLATGRLKGKNLTEVFGRGSPKDRGDVYLRARELNPKLDLSQGDVEYMAGQKKATAIAGVQGAEGQKIGAATASMEDMLDKARPLIGKVSPSKMRSLNSLLQKWGNETNDPDLKQVNIYLHSAAGFYATLKKNGGTPDTAEKEEALRDMATTLNSGGFAAVEKALRDEGSSRVKRIKENQSQTEPGSAGTVSRHDGVSKTYTYPDGTKAMWDGKKWVRQ